MTTVPTEGARCWQIENALAALHDAVLDALEQNPRIKLPSKIVLEARLAEAREALHLEVEK